ncbi:MAG TPA: hypothetical protein VEI82_12535 [Myxococcota bacterium]|nr:hypothetical protein [Myxococcota bacterium]
MRRLGLLLYLALSGCLPMVVPGRLDVARRAERPAVCESRQECDAVWPKAVDWVAHRCAFDIKTQTDSLVETEGPAGAPSTDVACRLERAPAHEAGQSQLELTASCGNWFECLPERDYFLAAFNDDMRAAIEASRAPATPPAPAEAPPQP